MPISISTRNTSAQGGNSSPPEHPYVASDARTDCKVRSMVFTGFWDTPIAYNDSMKYLIQGTEVCPTTGRVHQQGYVYWNHPRSVKNICKKWGCWVRPANGTPQQASDYCKKGGQFVEHGKLPRQGRRTDLEDLAQKILSGETSAEDVLISEPSTYHQYGRTIEKLEDVYRRKQYRKEMTTCEWIVGPTGVGKSQKAFANYSPDTHYNFNVRDKGWWEGYRQQETVIINDYRGQIDYDQLLNLVDWVPMTVPRRNREPMPFTSKHIIITSPLTPEEVYNKRHSKDCLSQLLRRITVTHMESNI